ncbi:hypothetical protein B0H14DRAFT_2578915 [Mycena olivaceomarginata]|nr:hypothetical protein B0H14DRAFT_2578915 [Mycena olivaceomarginata]
MAYLAAPLTFDGDFFGRELYARRAGVFDPGDDDEEGTPDSESDDDEDPSTRDHEDASHSEQVYKSSLADSAARIPTHRLLPNGLGDRQSGAKLVARVLPLPQTCFISTGTSGPPKFTRSESSLTASFPPVLPGYSSSVSAPCGGDTSFAPYLFVVPEQHYMTRRRRSACTTIGIQVMVVEHADKTQLTRFRQQDRISGLHDHWKYPERNLSQSPLGEAYVLLGYLPTSRMKNVKNKAARRRILAKSFMRDAGITGIPMTSREWRDTARAPHLRHFRPAITQSRHSSQPSKLANVLRAKFLATSSGRTLLTTRSRDLEKILDALDSLDSGPTAYAAACAEASIKPIYHPFWEGTAAISPDILHQLYQGIVKHLIAWLTECVEKQRIDAPLSPSSPQPQHPALYEWISNLSRVTGKEHDQISRFILALIIDSWASETTSTFQTPFLPHYIMYIKLFGTTDNYNTEYSLHIDLAKDAYRSTNFKDEFPQMTLWLERKEKIYRHER